MSRFGFSPAVKTEAPAASPVPAQASAPLARAKPEPAGFDLLDAKLRVHAKLIDELDLSALDKMDDDTMRRRVRGIIGEIIRKEEMALSSAEEASFADAVMDEMTGLGPIEPLLKDDSIADILINGYNQVYVERHGKLQIAPVRFADNDHLLRIVQRIVAAVGRRGPPSTDRRPRPTATPAATARRSPPTGRRPPPGQVLYIDTGPFTVPQGFARVLGEEGHGGRLQQAVLACRTRRSESRSSRRTPCIS